MQCVLTQLQEERSKKLAGGENVGYNLCMYGYLQTFKFSKMKKLYSGGFSHSS